MKRFIKNHIYLYLSLVFFLHPNTCNAEDNNTIFDQAHSSISEKVLDWSEYLDIHISSWLDNNTTNNKVCLEQDIIGFRGEDKYREYNVDSFFQSNKYFNETEDIYVRLRLNNYLYSKKSNKVNVKLNAQLPFNRCKRQWKFFLQDPANIQRENSLTDTSSDGVGIRYYKERKGGIDSGYSLGFTAGSPYVRARYKFPIELDTWKIEPIQLFKYSKKYYFEEETNIYFDKPIDDDLFRISLHRKSASTLTGTDYSINFQYYLYLGKNAGLEFTQSFTGNTDYSHRYSSEKNYHDINNYVSSISWRENIWRKWLYFEVKPTINFHKDFNYKPSYEFHFLFDIYFGEYN